MLFEKHVCYDLQLSDTFLGKENFVIFSFHSTKREMIVLAVCAHELNLLLFLAHAFDFVSHLFYHNDLLRSWFSFTQNMLTRKLNTSLRESCQVW